jgi:Ca-activated chloride channel family protein
MLSSTPSRISSLALRLSGLRSWRGCTILYYVVLIVVLVSPGDLFAQQTPLDEEVLRVDTNLLVVPIRVRNKNRGTVTSLTEGDLILKDDDHVTAALYLKQGMDRVALVFALDQSGSTREIISQQRRAAIALFEHFGERSKIAVLRFAESAQLVAPFGRDTSVASEAFVLSVAPNQHTAIFDAAVAALQAFEGLPSVRSERRIVILISDGLDNASRTKPSSVIATALQKRVSFYVIHLPLFAPRDGRLAVRSPAKGFKDLADKTGGKYFLAADSKSALTTRGDVDLTPIFKAIEDDLRSQYLLGYYFAENAQDGRRHRFEISLPAGLEYQFAGSKYSRSHEFFSNLPGTRAPRPQ